MGIGYIPVSEIEAWCRINAIDDPALLTNRVQTMDRIYVDWAREKQDKEKTERDRPKLILPNEP